VKVSRRTVDIEKCLDFPTDRSPKNCLLDAKKFNLNTFNCVSENSFLSHEAVSAIRVAEL
jgi:hypothetical protein